jgi:hypothetical protein
MGDRVRNPAYCPPFALLAVALAPQAASASGFALLERAEAIVVASGVGITSEFRNGGSEPALLQPLGDGGDAGGGIVGAAFGN